MNYRRTRHARGQGSKNAFLEIFDGGGDRIMR
jgi:hypothetical protein